MIFTQPKIGIQVIEAENVSTSVIIWYLGVQIWVVRLSSAAYQLNSASDVSYHRTDGNLRKMRAGRRLDSGSSHLIVRLKLSLARLPWLTQLRAQSRGEEVSCLRRGRETHCSNCSTKMCLFVRKMRRGQGK